MKLYVCYGTFKSPKLPSRPNGHVCEFAHTALLKAGYRPEVVKAYGFGPLPDWMNATKGRREVRELTGNNWVPLLVTDDGEAIQGSERIAEWAASHPSTPS